MSKKTLIYTEGKSDKNFLSWCLDVWEYQAHFDIIHVEGKDKLFSDEFYEKIEDILTNNNPRYKQVCIIFDADIKEENQESDAGFDNKLKHIYEKFKEKGIDFLKEQIFLFPNNQDDGDLETLLLEIAKHKEIIQCFKRYLKCIECKCIGIKEHHGPIKNIRKNMLYAYLEVFELQKFFQYEWDINNKENEKKIIIDDKGKIKEKYKEEYEKLKEAIDFSSNFLIPLKNF
ncbi:hypothetical protein HMPREF1399_01602 [Helicobacter pylori GAM118Bi]|uniref:DUF3226 domain-containing protein n=1 Tax=Helicobacter pylori TaxID=210 RepID=UPI0002BB63BF|nr:hypothetical protein HMPREF1399_01602 [Helicobacter pylori GAM118Bi]